MERARKFTIDELYKATKVTLLKYGYEGFTFTLLADYLEVSRGTLYRYFDNKEELVSTFMLVEMEQFLSDLKRINDLDNFDQQFTYLLEIIFKHNDIHQLLGFSYQIPANTNEIVINNKKELERKHQHMYKYLQHFVRLGKEEKVLNPNILDNLILGLIFQSVMIPNHDQLPQSEWITSIKKVISHGIFT